VYSLWDPLPFYMHLFYLFFDKEVFHPSFFPFSNGTQLVEYSVLLKTTNIGETRLKFLALLVFVKVN
jgi:hypothetical protein